MGRDDRHKSFRPSELDELKEKYREKYRRDFQLDQFVINTLDHFAYRYLATEQDSVLKVESVGECAFGVKSTERNVQRALADISDRDIREKIKASCAQSLLYGLYVEIESFDGQKGRATVIAFINWDDPDLSIAALAKTSSQKCSIDFDGPLELRNQLPTALEQICALFV